MCRGVFLPWAFWLCERHDNDHLSPQHLRCNRSGDLRSRPAERKGGPRRRGAPPHHCVAARQSPGGPRGTAGPCRATDTSPTRSALCARTQCWGDGPVDRQNECLYKEDAEHHPRWLGATHHRRTNRAHQRPHIAEGHARTRAAWHIRAATYSLLLVCLFISDSRICLFVVWFCFIRAFSLISVTLFFGAFHLLSIVFVGQAKKFFLTLSPLSEMTIIPLVEAKKNTHTFNRSVIDRVCLE